MPTPPRISPWGEQRCRRGPAGRWGGAKAPYKRFAFGKTWAAGGFPPPENFLMGGAPLALGSWGRHNAAMIGCQGFYEYQAGHVAWLDRNAYATRDISLG